MRQTNRRNLYSQMIFNNTFLQRTVRKKAWQIKSTIEAQEGSLASKMKDLIIGKIISEFSDNDLACKPERKVFNFVAKQLLNIIQQYLSGYVKEDKLVLYYVAFLFLKENMDHFGQLNRYIPEVKQFTMIAILLYGNDDIIGDSLKKLTFKNGRKKK